MSERIELEGMLYQAVPMPGSTKEEILKDTKLGRAYIRTADELFFRVSDEVFDMVGLDLLETMNSLKYGTGVPVKFTTPAEVKGKNRWAYEIRLAKERSRNETDSV